MKNDFRKIIFLIIFYSHNFILSQPEDYGLVDIKKEIPNISLDIRYATSNNFVGEKLVGYEMEAAWGLKEMVLALKSVQLELNKQKMGLKIFDAYRPLSAEIHMLKWAKENKKNHLLGVYIPLNINKNSLYGHTSGNMIDLSIIDENGKQLDMGTDFDEFSEKAHTLNVKASILRNRLLLLNVMKKYGFVNYKREWWHYTYKGASGVVLDIPIK